MHRQQTTAAILKAALMLLLIIITITAWRVVKPAFAQITGDSDALTDLRIDSDFIITDYTPNDEDYSIQVIQIAESADKGLYLYTYQPCQKTRYLVATKVNMSLSENIDETRHYNLRLINTSGVFGKYSVEGVTVSEANQRYYNITSVFRVFDEEIDKPTGNDNKINGVSFEVGKCFRAETQNGKVTYACKAVETITVTEKYCDELRYSEGIHFLNMQWCDSHYVAFATDKPMDYLFEADLTYIKRPKTVIYPPMGAANTIYGEPETVPKVKITCTEKGGNAADGFKSKKYTWDRIQSVSKFIKTEELTETAKENLENKQWVLRFLETEYTEVTSVTGGGQSCYSTKVDEVSILRLKYITNGRVYNLGVVDNLQSSDGKPDNTNTNEYATFFEWLGRVLGGVPWWVWLMVGLMVLAILLPILSLVFPAVGVVLKYIFKAIIWLIETALHIIAFPFLLIWWLILKIRGE